MIVKFDSSGNRSTFTSGLNWPKGLAFDSSGNLYVTIQSDNTIVKFDLNGNGSVFANSGLNEPMGLDFDSSGNLYVVSYGNNTIEKFDSSGNRSVFASGLDHPQFIAVIPEPATIGLLGFGGLALLRKRGKRSKCYLLKNQ
jgi:DNA-binding beta-propeller fold protein YncE